MASVESNIINAVRDALISNGYTVFDSIIDHHTGRATKSKTYVMIGRSMSTDWTEITDGTITGPFSLALRYYQGTSKVNNRNNEMINTSTACFMLEEDISQVQTGNMYNRLNISREPTQATNLRGFTADYTLTGTLAACQDRSGFDPNSWNELGEVDTTWDDLLTTTWDSLEPA